MDVVISITSKVKVDYCAQRVRIDVKSTSGNTCRDEEGALLLAEVLEDLGSVYLRFLPMQGLDTASMGES